MLFLTLSNTNIRFVEKKLVLRSYMTTEALPIIKKVELINKTNFAAIALDKNKEIYVIHIATLLAVLIIAIYFSQVA